MFIRKQSHTLGRMDLALQNRSSRLIGTWGILAAIVFATSSGISDCQAQSGIRAITGAQIAPSSPDEEALTATGAPSTITLQDALGRARKNYAQYRAAETAAQVAQEDRVQARAGLLPSVNYTQQYLGTQGNGQTPNGRFVTNDGVHVYRAWGVLHQDISANTFTLAPYRRATVAATLAQAQAEIARRGLVVTVTSSFYGLIGAQRKYSSAQQSLNQAQQFLQLTQQLEQGGAVAHADVLKAELQVDQQKVSFQDAQLTMENAHLSLGVLLSQNFDENFTAVDDADDSPVLPPFSDIKTMAGRQNQTVRSAVEALRQSRLDVKIARAAFFPTLVVDVDYGIEANALALRSTVAADPLRGPLPNLGYFVTAALNVPIWNWGAT